jgi:hypothetical protein
MFLHCKSYIDKYKAKAHFNHTLVEVDGANKRAYFKSSEAGKENDGDLRRVRYDSRVPATEVA